MPNNILITPGSASIQFSGSAANTIRLQVEPSGAVAFYGNSGSFFNIADNLLGATNTIITGSLIVSSSLPIELQVIGVSEVSGSMNISGSLFTNTYSLVTRSLGNASGSMSIDLSSGNYFTAITSMSTTWTFTNPQTNRAVGFVLALASGGFATQIWPSTVRWPGASAPTLTPSGGVDILTFITDNTGATWRGVFSMVDSR